MPTSTTKKKAAAKAVPPHVKQPDDHKEPAAEAPSTRTVEVRGREWTIPVAALDDFELMDDLNVLETKGDPSRLPAVLRRLLGPEGFAEAMDLCRDPDTGRVTLEAGTTFVTDLMSGLNPNSSRS